MTPADVSAAVLEAVLSAIDAGELPIGDDDRPRSAHVERPKQPEHGDYATNVALILAKKAGMPPRDIAEAVKKRLESSEGILSVEVAGPGFLNMFVAADALGRLAADVVEAGRSYGRTDSLAGQRFNVEFISANPTGPLHLGHTRWAAVGDALARVLEAAGAEVAREFYVNDRGSQMDRFGESIMAAAHGRPVPEDGYHGGYVMDLAAEIVDADPGIRALPEQEQFVEFRERGYQLQLAAQRRVLALFGTHFDVWYSERSLHDSGAVNRGFDVLREQGWVYEEKDASWLRTTEFGDDKDRVLVKANGELTYFASDTAYYIDKRDRGFDVCLYLLGADHHGYVGRLKAIAACAGDDPDHNIEVLIGQLVKIMKGGEELRLSKRAGNIITLEDLVDEVGVDAARYTLTRYPADTPLTLDIEEMVKRTNDNPVFYVQYAHARISSVLRNAGELGIDWASAEFHPGLLDHERETDLLTAIGEFPRIVATAAEFRHPHRIARYLEELATAYHKFYDSCRVLPRGDEETSPQHVARLWLCGATRQTLANGLDMLGVRAPERM